ncbi:T-complex protein 11-like protein 2 [Notothenia coriiceps]|uniref:T-complex protein 11-like protein 2 n=1 Tax=Notothenia coriiceps TaxID=8208 RepID=A0A6I9Q5S2_9TELE|nr:PREDICTED: T-complex protein 11-like protein 2 [Notothenia coriiceps]
MPLNDERPASTSDGEQQDVESSSERSDSVTSASSRESFTSDGSSKHCTPSSSPPKTLTLDEVMESARDLSSLRLAHEIAVNQDFHVEPQSLPEGSLTKLVRDTLHKAFWDILASELTDDPPEYGQAIRLLAEIREIVLSFLNPGANRMRTQIMEVLDMDLIRQQADNNAVDIQGLASYIISTMGKLCCPVRDEEIKKLSQNSDNMVTMFREIFRLLDLMKTDLINYEVDSLRLLLQRHGAECEREMFQSVLDKTPSALNHTTSWLKSALEELTNNIREEQTHSQGKGQLVPGPFQALNIAFLHILTWENDKNPLPETLMNDEIRLQKIQQQLQLIQAVNEVLLIIFSTVGGAIQGLPLLSGRLKRMTGVLLEGMHSPDFNQEEALEGVSAQICSELNKSLTERSYPPLSPALQATLTGQILSITQKDNPIRTLVEDRVQQYFMVLICDPKPQSKLEQVPVGLTAIKPELACLGARFISLVNYNITVYGPTYGGILRKLMFNSSPPPANPPQDTAQDSVTSK